LNIQDLKKINFIKKEFFVKKLFIILLIFITAQHTSAQKKNDSFDEEYILSKDIRDQTSSIFIPTNIRLFSQALEHPFPKQWPIKPANRKETGGHFMMEWVPSDQTLENWQDLFSVQAFEGLSKKNIPIKAVIGMFANYLNKASPNQLYLKEIYNGEVSGHKAIIVLMGLKKLENRMGIALPNGIGEIGIYIYIQGSNDIYVIHRAWKSEPYTKDNLPINQKEIDQWVKEFKDTKLSDIVDTRANKRVETKI
jgi:hypothetical protein